MSLTSGNKLPTARYANLVTTETASDVLVYDTERNELHTLNAVAASVWRAADGTRSLSDLTLITGLDTPTVEMALDRLAAADLLSNAPARTMTTGRRRFLKQAGVTGAVVISVSAPAAALASTGGAACGETCPSGLNSECNSSCSQCRQFPSGSFQCCNPGQGGNNDFPCPA